MPSGNYMILEPIERLEVTASRFGAAAIVVSFVVFSLFFPRINFVAIEISTSFCAAGLVLFCFIYDLVMMILGFLYECSQSEYKINDDSKAVCVSQWEGENISKGCFDGDTQMYFPFVFQLNLDLVGHEKCVNGAAPAKQ